MKVKERYIGEFEATAHRNKHLLVFSVCQIQMFLDREFEGDNHMGDLQKNKLITGNTINGGDGNALYGNHNTGQTANGVVWSFYLERRFVVKRATFVFLLLFLVNFVSPIIAHSENLILNGSFETGIMSPWLPNDNPTVTITGDYKIDGEYSVFIDTTSGTPDSSGEWRVGLWQYPGIESGTDLPDDYYTVSAWVFPIQGQAHIGLAYGGGSFQYFSSPTLVLNEWQYLEVTGF